MDSPVLTWRVPFNRIVEAVQTVGGIAKLAGVSRETVRRKKIPVGGLAAISFAINATLEKGKPLVTHRDPRHELNLKRGLMSGNGGTLGSPAPVSVAEVVAACHLWFGPHTTHQTYQIPSEKLGQAETPLQAEWNKRQRVKQASRPRKLKVSPGVNVKWGTDEVLKGHDAFGYRYKPKTRVTVAVLCSRFQIQRRQFYRWKETLTDAERQWLADAMSGKTFTAAAVPAADVEPLMQSDLARQLLDAKRKMLAGGKGITRADVWKLFGTVADGGEWSDLESQAQRAELAAQPDEPEGDETDSGG